MTNIVSMLNPNEKYLFIVSVEGDLNDGDYVTANTNVLCTIDKVIKLKELLEKLISIEFADYDELNSDGIWNLYNKKEKEFLKKMLNALHYGNEPETDSYLTEDDEYVDDCEDDDDCEYITTYTPYDSEAWRYPHDINSVSVSLKLDF